MAELESLDQYALGVVRDTWDLFRRDPLLYLIAGLAVFFLSAITLGLCAGPLTAGYIELVRHARRNEPLALGIVFSRFDTWVPSLVASGLILVAVLIGFLLFIIPGLVVAVVTIFTLTVITYENTTGVAAIRRSIEIVRTSPGQTLALLLLLLVLHALGSILVLGMVLTVPLSIIPLTLGYERLVGARGPEALTI